MECWNDMDAFLELDDSIIDKLWEKTAEIIKASEGQTNEEGSAEQQRFEAAKKTHELIECLRKHELYKRIGKFTEDDIKVSSYKATHNIYI